MLRARCSHWPLARSARFVLQPSMLWRWLTLLAWLTASGSALGVRADASPQASPAPNEEAGMPWRVGPAALALGHGVSLELPAGYQFLAQPHAGKLMTRLGNLYNDNLLGLVVSSPSAQGADAEDYLITLRYDEEGFVKDDEKLDGAELLDAIREGEGKYNQERKKAGFPPIHADRWQETPHYDGASHRVIWGLLLSNPESQSDRSINYNTRVLGRKGYVSINLVTDPEKLARYKPAAATILASTSFVSGMRYEDFNEKTDKVAEYGLTGLVLGGVGLGLAKLAKVGLLAKFGKVIIAALIAGKKAIVALLLAAAAGARKFLGRGKRDESGQA